MPKRQWSLCVPILKAAGPCGLSPSCLELDSRCWDGQLFSQGKPGSLACLGLEFSLGWPSFCGWSSSTLILVSVHSKAEIPRPGPTESTYVFYIYKYVFSHWIEWSLKVPPSLKLCVYVCVLIIILQDVLIHGFNWRWRWAWPNGLCSFSILFNFKIKPFKEQH